MVAGLKQLLPLQPGDIAHNDAKFNKPRLHSRVCGGGVDDAAEDNVDDSDESDEEDDDDDDDDEFVTVRLLAARALDALVECGDHGTFTAALAQCKVPALSSSLVSGDTAATEDWKTVEAEVLALGAILQPHIDVAGAANVEELVASLGSISRHFPSKVGTCVRHPFLLAVRSFGVLRVRPVGGFLSYCWRWWSALSGSPSSKHMPAGPSSGCASPC